MKFDAKVVSNEQIGDKLFHMKLDCGKIIKAAPGQFINILVSETYTPLLRRPFSIFNAGKKSVEIVYKVIGEGTKLLSGKKPGNPVNFLGPLGNSYFDFYSKIQNPNSKIVLIGGGTGAASIHFLAKELRKKKIKFTLIQGAKCKGQLVFSGAFKKLGCSFATDDGSYGEKGFVTDILNEILNKSQVPNPRSQGRPKSKIQNPKSEIVYIFACGPKPMLRAVKDATFKKGGAAIFASLEEYMGCGIGACLSCAVEVKAAGHTEYKRVCRDGTVFNLNDIIL